MTGEQEKLIEEYQAHYADYNSGRCIDFENRLIKSLGDIKISLVTVYEITARDVIDCGYLPEVLDAIDNTNLSPEMICKNQVMLHPHTFIENLVPREMRLCDGK
jgi:hypothetical protein